MCHSSINGTAFTHRPSGKGDLETRHSPDIGDISGLSTCLMIHRPAMDYNLPASFGADAKLHPRFPDGRRQGKLIIGRIVVIGTLAVVPALPIDRAMFANPFMTLVKFMMPVASRRSMPVIMFLVPVDFGFVMNRPTMGTASVIVRLDALCGPIIALSAFFAASPGSTREYKNQRCHHYTDLQ